ncbi:MerR family transcriptional regulator [Schaalia cardiffensis F0333]|uniref:MerR family transcriptional regulator n=1 Tax=Schaalia cardiffensis F0333 TaxID=888050 RepID=N6WB67_9ACTO|nr:MerR family transcriptional regulator [Schaalia cardiffensis]ENO17499.1 MerR family transcriptional regulator [Schaalia cardiffensis F0333]
MSTPVKSQVLQEEASEAEIGPWPRGVDRTPSLSIGQVVSELKAEFPAISLSKVRFLEEQGLVSPARTGSGYRKYSRADIERLRFVLSAQRDSFTPLKVIGDQLRALDAGHEVEPARHARVVASEGKIVTPSNGRPISARDLADLTGVDLEGLERYVRFGLISPDIAGYFPARAVQIVQILVRLEAAGFDARILRSVRTGAERSADIVDQTVSSQRSRVRSGDAERANARILECGELLAELHRELLRVSLTQLQVKGT